MSDETKSEEQLLQEIARLRRRVSELESPGEKCKLEEAHPSEGSYRLFVEQSEWPVCFVDQNGVFLMMNIAAAAQMGGAPDDLVGKSIRDLFPKDMAARHIGAITEAIDSGKAVSTENVTVINGEQKFYKAHIKPIEGSDETLPYVQIIANDITARKRTETALRESEEKYRGLFTQSPEAIFIMSLDGVIRNCNKAATLTGFKREEIIGKTFSDLNVFDGDSKQADAMFARIVQGDVEPFELSLKTRTGEWMWVEIHPAIISEGGNTNLRFMVRDITMRKRAEEEMCSHAGELALLARTTMEFLRFPADGDMYRFIAERLRELAPESLIAVTRLNEETGELSAAALLGLGDKLDTVAKIIGYDPYGILIKGSPQLIEDLSRGRLVEFPGNVHKITSGKVPKTAAKAIEMLFGFSHIYVMGFENEGRLFGSVVILPKKGKEIENHSLIEAFVGQAAVALEHRRAEEALRESEEKYRTILDRIVEGYFEVDLAGNLTFFNEALCNILGYSAEEMIGLNNRKYMDEDNAKKVFEIFNHVYNTDGYSKASDWQLIRKNGDKCFVETSVLLKKDASGTPVGFRGLTRDITARKQAEEELRSKEEQLQHAQKMEAIGRLAGGVAHDINNMLSGIMGYASLMQMDLEPGDQCVEDTGEIISICRSARELTGNLLGFARKGKYRKERIDLNKSIRHVREILKRTISKKIKIEIQSANNLSEVEGDSDQIEQVFMNLCINAADAIGDAGKLTMITSETTRDQAGIDDVSDLKPGQYVKVAVTDTGEGMDEAVLAKAFDPFFTTKPRGKGTGLGLSMVYGTIKNHGGTVALDSEPGRGTTVTILLPAINSSIDATHGNQNALASEKGTILLVDDEDTVRRSTARLLKKARYQVIQSKNGEEAIDVYQRKQAEIDLVLLDMIMPMMNGTETFHRLKELDPGVRVLLFSGSSADAATNSLISEGSVSFIQKPFPPKNLVDQVAKMLEPSSRIAPALES
ncbi:MAG: PAS domain S-box protein [Deltaproteobacteria bacterium]|nr:PAS domain S-box protein [Deltaproteobacteria bacterium]